MVKRRGQVEDYMSSADRSVDKVSSSKIHKSKPALDNQRLLLGYFTVTLCVLSLNAAKYNQHFHHLTTSFTLSASKMSICDTETLNKCVSIRFLVHHSLQSPLTE